MKKIIITVFALATIISCKNEKKEDKSTGTKVEKTTEKKNNLPSAETIVNNYFKAIGGIDKVKAIKTLITISETEVDKQIMQVVTKSAVPNKFTTTFTTKDGETQRQFFNGTEAFIEIDQKKELLSKEEAEAFKSETTPFADFAFINGKVQGIEKVDGIDTYVIKKGDRRFFYSVKSKLKIKNILTLKDGQTGTPVDLPTYYSNYKEVNGIKFPHSVIQGMGETMPPMEFTFKKFIFNKNVTDKDFQ